MRVGTHTHTHAHERERERKKERNTNKRDDLGLLCFSFRSLASYPLPSSLGCYDNDDDSLLRRLVVPNRFTGVKPAEEEAGRRERRRSLAYATNHHHYHHHSCAYAYICREIEIERKREKRKEKRDSDDGEHQTWKKKKGWVGRGHRKSRRA